MKHIFRIRSRVLGILLFCTALTVAVVSWNLLSYNQNDKQTKMTSPLGKMLSPIHPTLAVVDLLAETLERKASITGSQQVTVPLKRVTETRPYFSQPSLNTKNVKPIQLLFFPDLLTRVKSPRRGTAREECDIPCVYGRDTSPSALSSTDAVVFHLPDERGQDPRTVMERMHLNTSGVLTVGMTMEPTAKYKEQFNNINQYDIEMSFRMNSDVPMIFHKFWKKERDLLLDPLNNWESRRKAVAFVADNCHTASHREDLVKLLQKHIKVESVSTCLPNAPWPADLPRTNRRLNKVVLLRRYLAYLAAENSFEWDYVSEKVYDALIAGVVPIYYGAPNIDSFVPSNTTLRIPQNYTEADVLRVVEELQRVFRNKEVYEKWMSFKHRPLDEWFVQRFNFTRSNMKCRLCRRVYAMKHGLGWDQLRQQIIH